MQPVPPCPAPAWWWRMSVWASSALGVVVRCIFCGFCFIYLFFLPIMLSLRFQNSPQTHMWEGLLLFGNFSSFMTPSPGWVSVPNSFVSLFVFYILSYLLSKRMGCISRCLVSSASIQKLLSIQMVFWWICGGESGLPILFLCHLGTTSWVTHFCKFSLKTSSPSIISFWVFFFF